MGMFDKPEYLTGKDGKGYVTAGESFYLHNARQEGTVTISGQARPQWKLKVSHTATGDTSIVFTSGAGIVGQLSRMDDADRAAFPMHLRLDAIAPKVTGHNATHVLTPADQPEPASAADADDEIPF